MNSLDQQVLSQLASWLEAGKHCWLCTITDTFGSSPRPIGSLLVCNQDGLHCGSLSGGCVEDDMRASLFRGELATTTPALMKYGVAVEDVLRLGLPCGGSMQVLIEPIAPAAAAFYRSLADSVGKRVLVQRQVDIRTGATSVHDIARFQPLQLDGDILHHTYGPSFQLLLIGAVQVAWYLADMAQALDYEVEICDPRKELVDNSPPVKARLTVGMPDDWLRGKIVDQQTAVIALCHDPRIDDMALMEALNQDAFYIGAMGSDRTSTKRRERLLSLDIPKSQIDRLHAPVGLPLGSKTPPEIAIAILAELTQLRASIAKRA